MIFGSAVCLSVVASTEFFWFYLPNSGKHRRLLERNGEDYLRCLEQELSEKGIGALIRERWLDKQADL